MHTWISIGRRAPLLGAAIAIVIATHAVRGDPPGDRPDSDRWRSRFERLFRPFETAQVALSPNGERVVYTRRRMDNLILFVRDFRANTVRQLPIGIDDAVVGAADKLPATLDYLAWATDDWLVFNLKRTNVWSLSADLTQRRLLGNHRDFRRNHDKLPEAKVEEQRDFVPAVEAPSALPVMSEQGSPIKLVTIAGSPPQAVLETTVMEGVRPHIEIYRAIVNVDVISGNKSEVIELPTERPVIYDRAGNARLYEDDENLWILGPDKRWSKATSLAGCPLRSRSSRSSSPNPTPIAFDGDQSTLYCFESTSGRLTLFGIDTRTWTRTDFHLELKGTVTSDDLVFDRWRHRLTGLRRPRDKAETQWLDPEIEDVQRSLDATKPTRHWQILDWTLGRDTYLVLESGEAEPGKYCLFHPDNGVLNEFLDIAPWLEAEEKNQGLPFSDPKSRLTGYLTLPGHPLLKHPPLVVFCQERRYGAVDSQYNREVQALAAMGFIVLQVNYRPTLINRHVPGRSPDDSAIRDIITAIDAMAPPTADKRLIAIMGREFGGYLALRAMELYPNRFCCGIAINAPTDLTLLRSRPLEYSHASLTRLKSTFAGLSDDILKEISPLNNSAKIQQPVMVAEASDRPGLAGREMVELVKKHSVESVYLPLPVSEVADLPHGQAALYEEVRGFLNLHVYQYAVRIGEAQVVDK